MEQGGREMHREIIGVLKFLEKHDIKTTTHLPSSHWLKAGKRESNLIQSWIYGLDSKQ